MQLGGQKSFNGGKNNFSEIDPFQFTELFYEYNSCPTIDLQEYL